MKIMNNRLGQCKPNCTKFIGSIDRSIDGNWFHLLCFLSPSELSNDRPTFLLPISFSWSLFYSFFLPFCFVFWFCFVSLNFFFSLPVATFIRIQMPFCSFSHFTVIRCLFCLLSLSQCTSIFPMRYICW